MKLFRIALVAGLFASLDLCLFGSAGGIAGDFRVHLPGDGFIARIVGNTERGAIAVVADDLYLYDARGNRISTFSSSLTITDVGEVIDSSDGELFVSGTFAGTPTQGESGTSVQLFHLVKLRLDGSQDTEFGRVFVSGPPVGDFFRYSISKLVADREGGCYAFGNFKLVNGQPVNALAHFDRFGNVHGLQVSADANVDGSLIIVADGSGLVLVGRSSIVRRSQNGDEQPFQVGVPIQWKMINGAIFDKRFGLAVVGREDSGGAFCVVYNLDGTRKAEFSSSVRFDDSAGLTNCIAWDNLGRLLIGAVKNVVDPDLSDGDIVTNSPLTGPSLIGFGTIFYSVKRLLPTGHLDPAWSRALWFNAPPTRLVVLSDDSAVVGGAFTSVCGHPRSIMTKLTGDERMNVHWPQHSARGQIDSGHPLFMGLVIEGSDAVDVLIRAVGPSLKGLGVKKTPEGTKFSVHRNGQLFVKTGSMTDSIPIRWVSAHVGAFPLDTSTASAEGTALLSLLPGIYTVVIESAIDGGSGEVLGEIYFP